MSIPNYVQPSSTKPQPAQSRHRLWLALAIAAGLIILLSVAFSVLVATSVGISLNAFFHTTDQSVPVAANYYLAFMKQDYAQAYTDLDSKATISGQRVDQQAFSALATAADERNGKVSGYSIDPARQGNDPSRLTITVHRGKQVYEVHLRLQQEGAAWKIISADGV